MKNKLPLLLTLFWMGIIFYFSAQPAADSMQSSGSILREIMNFFSGLLGWGTVSDSLVAQYQNVIRTAGHFTEYLVLGGLMTATIKRRAFSFFPPAIWAILLSTLYACSDELHQLFVKGRTCQWEDFLVDIAGILVGCAFFLLLKKKRN